MVANITCSFLHLVSEGLKKLENSKTRSRRAKKIEKIAQIFISAVTFSFIVTKRLKLKKNKTGISMGLSYFSENVFVTADNRLAFSIISLHGVQSS
jgi:hypothetical protein